MSLASLWVLFIASIVTMLAVGTPMKRLAAELHPRMIRLEIAGKKDDVNLVLKSWGQDGRRTAVFVLLLDYGFAVALGIAVATLALISGGYLQKNEKSWPWAVLWHFRRVSAFLAIMMMILDVLENTGALLLIAGVRRLVPRLTSVCTGLKYATGTLAILYPIVIVMGYELSALMYLSSGIEGHWQSFRAILVNGSEWLWRSAFTLLRALMEWT
jgi:hypothetical protein